MGHERDQQHVTVEPPRMYSWTVVAPDGGSRGLGALGVTDDRARALARLGDALRDAPVGARGLVHKVMLGFSRVGYLYESLEAHGRYDPDSGAVVWEPIPDPSPWGTRLHARVTDPPEAIGDAIPPEAIAAGLADYEAERDRP